ncbi:HAD family hydrolase [Halegenticoccus tardaugens]|uniref:HAD family hydrolase n=1 Tax=Halegenticoccus tardaugens TaxID=2071624 RepID=UPI0013E96479|nr:HAD family hydrolase [Halegenticoccus tardaugens]
MATIYVDLDGTLVRYARSYGELFASTCESLGVAVPDGGVDYYTESFFERFRSFDDDPYRDAAADFCATYDLDVDGAVFAEALVERELAASTVPAGAKAALAALSEDHALGVLSNGVGEVQRAKLAVHGLESLFDDVLVSHEVGAMKPDPALFAAAKELLPADRYVYVGDDARDDVEPARRAGFVTVRVADGSGTDGDAADSSADLRIAPDEFFRIAEVL